MIRNDNVARILHWCFAIAIICQLLSSLIMHRPYLGRHIGLLSSEAFFLHKNIGLVATFFVFCYWLWVLIFRRDKLLQLFPWWQSAGRRLIIKDALSLCRLRLPEHPAGGGLAGFVHGLGLLLVTLVGCLGTSLYFLLPRTAQMPNWVHGIKSLHGDFAVIIWWYLAGHVFMAAWHYWLRRS